MDIPQRLATDVLLVSGETVQVLLPPATRARNSTDVGRLLAERGPMTLTAWKGTETRVINQESSMIMKGSAPKVADTTSPIWEFAW
jgi:hypothetical protein